MITKTLDMPAGNDICDIYQQYMDQIARGRSVAIIAVYDPSGKPASYMYSCKLDSYTAAAMDVETSLLHSVAVSKFAHQQAAKRGCHTRKFKFDPYD